MTEERLAPGISVVIILSSNELMVNVQCELGELEYPAFKRDEKPIR